MTQERILEILRRKHGYFSGEEISDSLKISRQALWKHIQDLRDDGFDIVAVPHLGYRLLSIPDKLLPSEVTYNLNTEFIGKKIYYFDSISSTMDTALQKGMEGAPEGTLVLSEAQTKGKGRLGRSWDSPKYKGIYLSLIIRPKVLPNDSPILTLLASISICEAVKEVTGVEARIKWPNDIVVGNKKLGGVLTELNAETDQVHFMIIGTGINVNNDKNSLFPGATSLREQKKENINRIGLLQEILRRVEINYINFQKRGYGIIVDQWRNCNITLGKRVKIVCQKRHLEGEAVDIDTDGGLLIRNDSGLTEKVMAGDVVHCR